MITSSRKKNLSRISWLLLFVLTLEIIYPLGAYALTSGPLQPESQSFQQAGTSDMVDLFTGDMKYNIPLFDIDGYPVNLNYNSGISMDDEASWVGLGWNLNVGAINRQLRGVPDDFAGDTTTVTHYTKPKITVGGRVTVKSETWGIAGASGSFSLGVFSDNYTGIGAELGVNAGLSFSLAGDGYLTAGLGLGVLSSTASGVEVTPQVSLSIAEKSKDNLTVRSGLSASLGYNTRSGMKDLSLGSSFSMTGTKINKYSFLIPNSDKPLTLSTTTTGTGNFSTSSSFITYNTEPINPKVNIPYYSKYDSFSFDLGVAKTIVFTAGGGTGYRNVMRVLNEVNRNRSFGYLYSEKAKNQSNAVLDFIREQDNPVIPELPNLAMPIHTPDLFSYSGQTSNGQFRLYRGGTGIYFDNEATNISEVSTNGFDIGGGAYFHGGVTDFEQTTRSTSRKWSSDNKYMQVGDFQDIAYKEPKKEHIAFRQVGERVPSDAGRDANIYQNTPIAVNIEGKEALASFKNNQQVLSLNEKIEKRTKTPTATSISYLTAEEASKAGRDINIQSYPFNTPTFTPSNGHVLDSNLVAKIGRATSYRKAHHLSEITVTDQRGTRSVYGLPVYNVKQEEYTFAVGGSYEKFNQNQVEVSSMGQKPNHYKGIDHYYHKEAQPAYASSFLLTQVLSPDYIDKGKPGISEEDAGSAIKFNYSKVSQNYRWRTPFASKTPNKPQNAILNKGLLADPDDDKASIVYGEKELWYLSSIESKTKIAYFITEDRLDGIGASGWSGYAWESGARQKRLVEIRLYSKNNTTKPIKIVKLCHSYSLCPGTPNSIATGSENSCSINHPATAAGGKLTLERVWFEYGKSDKGKHHPYVFNYHNSGYSNSSATTAGIISYTSMAVDRWGSYKGNNHNVFSGLSNEEFPYTPQDDLEKVNKNAALWNLSSIELPSGGKINVDYESDDYAYVQNKKAMQMVPFETFDNGSDNDLTGTNGIKLTIDPSGAPSDVNKRTQWFKDTYLNGSDFLYTKLCIRMANDQNPAPSSNDKDFIATYCKVRFVSLNGNQATVLFENVSDGGVTDNPIRFAAWQNVKENYPRYAYSGFRNRIGDNSANSAVEGVVSAIVNAAKNLSELRENFYQKAKRKGWSREIVKTKSFVRLVKMDGKKLGGGLRVKKIKITDAWDEMAGASAGNGTYGQSYDYITERDGKIISSGVATYEPSVGNDENPLKQAVNYKQKIKGALSTFFSLEQPFGESLYPAPTVGYSKVTVRDLNATGEIDPMQRTGYLVYEFYTAKEFPVKVVATSMLQNNRPLSRYFSLVKSDGRHENILSQGYYLELNDMHGKAKTQLSYNQKDALIKSSRYFYNTEEIGPGEMRLKNQVSVIRNGNVESAIIGRELDFYTDFREHESSNIGRTYNIGVDVFPVIFLPFFALPHKIPRKSNNDYKLFRSACAVKVAQYYGVLDKVEQMENGSTITTENIAYDADTGEPVVTRTQNEFKKFVYQVNFPAHWAYSGMSGAYQNVGTLMKDLQVGQQGLQSPFKEILHGGDELLNLNNGKVYWVIDDGRGNKNLVDRQGYVKSDIDKAHTFKITRSGHRNQLATSISSLTCLENPIVDHKLVLDDLPDRSLKVLGAQAQTFSEDWYPERVAIKLDTNYVDVPAHYAWGVISVRDQFVTEDGNGCQHTNSDANNCKRRTFGKLVMSIYKSNVPNVQPAFIPENLVSYIGNINVYDYIIRDPDGPNTWHPVRNVNVYGKSEFIISMDNMYDDQYAILEEQGICGNNRGYGVRYGTSFSNGNYGVTQHYFGYVSNGTRPVITQQPINPYLMGYQGNWRPYSTKVLQLQREDFNSLSSKGSNVEKAGYVKDFQFNWLLQGYPLHKWVENPTVQWKTINTVTAYNRYGQEIENKDATDNRHGLAALGLLDIENLESRQTFGKYNAASFDFNGQLPSAVASNAMYREIYHNSFEDLFFRSRHFDDKKGNIRFKNGTNEIDSLLNSTDSHTGNYSLKLPVGGINLKTFAHYRPEGFTPFITQNQKKEYVVLDDKFFYGFEPVPKKKYLFTAWVKDGLTAVNKSITVGLALNGSAVELNCVAVVEKWKKIEGVIDLKNINPMQSISLTLIPTRSDVKVDDIRIHPFDSHMKTYSYDDKNYRLMAELDENAFASFYEYDDQGELVRVKKETERGIVTLKESRSSFKKKL